MEKKDEHTNTNWLSTEDMLKIETLIHKKPMNLFWELRSILYLGVLLFISGVGILIYKNIDSIGHIILLFALAALTVYCFYYAFINKLPYSDGEVNHPSPYYDYIVLLGCLLLGILASYAQIQFNFFGTHTGIATLIPTLVYFGAAYLYDHKGVLSLAISGLTAWIGISFQPFQPFNNFAIFHQSTIWPTIIFGITLAVFAYFSDKQTIKKHFCFSYNNFSLNLLFVATLAGLFSETAFKFLYFLLIAGLVFYFIKYALLHQSLMFLLLSVIYGYIGLTYYIFHLLIRGELLGSLSFALIYFVLSGLGVLWFFFNYKQILGNKK